MLAQRTQYLCCCLDSRCVYFPCAIWASAKVQASGWRNRGNQREITKEQALANGFCQKIFDHSKHKEEGEEPTWFCNWSSLGVQCLCNLLLIWLKWRHLDLNGCWNKLKTSKLAEFGFWRTPFCQLSLKFNHSNIRLFFSWCEIWQWAKSTGSQLWRRICCILAEESWSF